MRYQTSKTYSFKVLHMYLTQPQPLSFQCIIFIEHVPFVLALFRKYSSVR